MSKKSHCRLKMFNENHKIACPLSIQNGIYCCAFCFQLISCRSACKKSFTEMRGVGVRSQIADYYGKGGCKYQLSYAESKFLWDEFLFRTADIVTNRTVGIVTNHTVIGLVQQDYDKS